MSRSVPYDAAPTAGEDARLSDVLDRLGDLAEGRETVRVDDLLSHLSDRSLGVVLTVLGLVALIPLIGAIPGVSILVAVLVLASVGQSLAGRGGAPGLPGRIGRRGIGSDRLMRGVERARPWVERVDRVLAARLTVLTAGRVGRVAIALASAVLALSMIPLAVVPWGVTAPAAGICAFGLALIARDGLFALLGYGFAGLTIWLAVSAL